MTVPLPTAPISDEAPTVVPPPSLAEAMARAVLVVTGTVHRDAATGHRTLQVTELLRGGPDDLALLARVPVPDLSDGGEVVLVVGDGSAPGAPVGAPAGPFLLADPRQVDEAQVRRVLAGLPALAPVDGTPDELAAAADLVLVGGPTGAIRPRPGSSRPRPGSGRDEAGIAEVEVEVLVRELLAARPGAAERAGSPVPAVGSTLPVADRPRLWVAVDPGSADRFRRSIPGLWFVAVGDDGGLRSLTRSTPEQFLAALRPLRARLRTAAAPDGGGGTGG